MFTFDVRVSSFVLVFPAFFFVPILRALVLDFLTMLCSRSGDAFCAMDFDLRLFVFFVVVVVVVVVLL